MEQYMVYVNWKRKSQLPTAMRISAKNIDNLRGIVISERILDSDKVEDVSVFKIAKKTKKQTILGHMSKDQYITRWITKGKNGYPTIKDLRLDGTIWYEGR